MADLANKNRVKIVGILEEANVEKKQSSKTGQEFVTVNAKVRSTIDGAVKKIDVRFFTSAVNSKGEHSALYDSYVDMENLIGKKVDITGSISEDRYWSTRGEDGGQVVSNQYISGRFINGVADSTNDEATYEVSGFVVGFAEKVNKDKEVYRYDISIGQSDYAGKNMVKLTLHAQPEEVALVKALSGIDTGTTVELGGVLDFIEVEKTVEKAVGFGKPTMTTYVNRQRNFYIVNGSILDGEGVYSTDDINDLIATYKERDVEIQNKAKEKSNTKADKAPAAEPKRVSTRQASLI